MQTRSRWFPLSILLALCTSACRHQSAESKRQEAIRVAEQAERQAEEAKEKQHRKESMFVIESLRKEHKASPAWRLQFGPKVDSKREDEFRRHLYSIEIDDVLETTGGSPILFVASLGDIVRQGPTCRCVFSTKLDEEYVGLELECSAIDARNLIKAVDASSDFNSGFALVVREVSVTREHNRDFSIHTSVHVNDDEKPSADSEAEARGGLVLRGKLVGFAPIHGDLIFQKLAFDEASE